MRWKGMELAVSLSTYKGGNIKVKVVSDMIDS